MPCILLVCFVKANKVMKTKVQKDACKTDCKHNNNTSCKTCLRSSAHNTCTHTTEIRDEIKMIRENIGLRRSRKLQQLKHVVSMNNYDIINH